ncbi:hypothetical protein ECEC1736_0851, partial [Escherichia coli EC1736]
NKKGACSSLMILLFMFTVP